jgi:hypothetical protein
MPYRYTLSLRAPMKTPFLNHINVVSYDPVRVAIG